MHFSDDATSDVDDTIATYDLYRKLETLAAQLHEARSERDQMVARIAPLDKEVARIKSGWKKTKVMLDNKVSKMTMGVDKTPPVPQRKKVKVQLKKRDVGATPLLKMAKMPSSVMKVIPKMPSPVMEVIPKTPRRKSDFQKFWTVLKGRKRTRFKCASHTKRFLQSDAFKVFQKSMDWATTSQELLEATAEQVEMWEGLLEIDDGQSELDYWKFMTKHRGGVKLYNVFLKWGEA